MVRRREGILANGGKSCRAVLCGQCWQIRVADAVAGFLAGFLTIDFVRLKADVLAYTGHKGLVGTQGIGGF
ncbi:hypothetical protein [Desulfosporosinus burensis]